MKRLIKRILFKAPFLYNVLYRTYLLFHGIRSYLRYGDAHLFYGVSIEISTYCNRKCHYCPNSKYPTPEKYMDEVTFKRVINDLAGMHFSGIVSYVLYNEPLLNPMLPTFVGYTKQKLPNCYCKIVTNGDFLTLEYCERLLACGVDEFYITLHDRDPSKLLVKLEPVLKKHGGHITLDSLYGRQISTRAGLVKVAASDRAINKNCPYLRGLIIDYEGNVLLCCNDYFRKYRMGNVTIQSLSVIWKSFATVRARIRAGKYDLPICRACMTNDGGTNNG